jgi:adenylylsulfate kinase
MEKTVAWCVWITGLPGSGKSVVSNALLNLLEQRNVHAYLLSSDALRKVLTPKPVYSQEERDMVYKTIVYFASILVKNNVNVIIDGTGNLRRYRDSARACISRFMEVYLQCPIDVCIEREFKREKLYHAPAHIYAKALSGESSNVPGVGAPYEPPLNPEVILDAVTETPESAAEKILNALIVRGWIS